MSFDKKSLVPKNTTCTFCGRKPRLGERFGTGSHDWDKPGVICPECWNNAFEDYEIFEKPDLENDQ